MFEPSQVKLLGTQPQNKHHFAQLCLQHVMQSVAHFACDLLSLRRTADIFIFASPWSFVATLTCAMIGLFRCVILRLHGRDGFSDRLRAVVDARRNFHLHRSSGKAHTRRKTDCLCSITSIISPYSWQYLVSSRYNIMGLVYCIFKTLLKVPFFLHLLEIFETILTKVKISDPTRISPICLRAVVWRYLRDPTFGPFFCRTPRLVGWSGFNSTLNIN